MDGLDAVVKVFLNTFLNTLSSWTQVTMHVKVFIVNQYKYNFKNKNHIIIKKSLN